MDAEIAKKKKTRVRYVPLQFIKFTDADYKANQHGTLTNNQRDELYARWFKNNVNIVSFAIMVTLITGVLIEGVFEQDSLITITLVVLIAGGLFVSVKLIYKLVRDHVLQDTKIASIVGVATPYDDDEGWYVGFNDKVVFEITDQPNTVFKSNRRYKVFMTRKDKIIVSAKVLES